MKYVRTENAIEEVLREEGELIFTRHGYIPKDMAIKASDSIEKLCDVLVAKDGEKVLEYFTPALDRLGIMKDNFKAHGHEVYGALWIDNHLVYVAKMNNEREFELL